MTEAAQPETPAVETPTDNRLNVSEGSEFTIPDAYKDAKWSQNIKSSDDLWKEVETLQPLIGKKSIPTNESTPEEWEEFYSKLRPESPDNYEVNLPEGFSSEDLNEETFGKYKELFHKAGLTQQQAQILFDGDLELRAQDMLDTSEEGFKTAMGDLFGEQSNEAMKVANGMLRMLPEDQAKAIQGLPNEQLVSVVKLLNDVSSKYSREDSPIAKGGQGVSKSRDELRNEIVSLRAELRGMNFMSPEYKEKNEKLNGLSTQLSRLDN